MNKVIKKGFYIYYIITTLFAQQMNNYISNQCLKNKQNLHKFVKKNAKSPSCSLRHVPFWRYE